MIAVFRTSPAHGFGGTASGGGKTGRNGAKPTSPGKGNPGSDGRNSTDGRSGAILREERD